MLKHILCITLLIASPVFSQAHKEYSGIYPHLAFFNNEDECGTGAVVPWADRLWAVTYAPHKPQGSTDKLYEITTDLQQIIRPESIGGTPANRMIHRETNQLFIGPYVIDAQRNVRVIPYSDMFGRPTGNARHLTDPANRIYSASMEEALYEVDVNSLKVITIYHDEQVTGKPKSGLPGYHGKGLYSGQGRLIYANNGENSTLARRDPFITSGALAEWDGSEWNVILRNQFTEVTGPGGLYGNPHPDSDPVWSIGWDARSLILMLLDNGSWHKYRLPKASHSYDGAHGWNTEWPRIRNIGEEDLLMTMHGMFWRFPKTFTASNSAGIAPRSTYLKVVGDFCRWQDRIVLGCDDTAKNEFLNKRKAKGHITAPQSQSNLWFLEPDQLDHLGPVIGRGAVWLNDKVAPNEYSDPFLMSGFTKRAVHLITDDRTMVTFEIDVNGNGDWEILSEVQVHGYLWYEFDDSLDAAWIRLRTSSALSNVTAWFHFAGDDHRTAAAVPAKFTGIAKQGETSVTGGLIRAQSENRRTLQFAAINTDGRTGYYTLDEAMNLRIDGDDQTLTWLRENAAIPSRKGVLEVDDASVIYIDDNGKRFRLPKNPEFEEGGPLGFGRLCREVATERDLFNCQGTFFELPANNAGGFSFVRPVATHNRRVFDYCSYRGLLVISGINLESAGDNRHIILSDDGKTALWVGAIDDIWELGKPEGVGGPWLNTTVESHEYSDPYLMTGYDQKNLKLKSSVAATISAEIDITGMGDWCLYNTFHLQPVQPVEYQFPRAFQAYWIRFKSDANTTATVQLSYR
ncbi:hypothetical protein ACFL47_00735 [Candidatus Latescibacterota bacterium]